MQGPTMRGQQVHMGCSHQQIAARVVIVLALAAIAAYAGACAFAPQGAHCLTVVAKHLGGHEGCLAIFVVSSILTAGVGCAADRVLCPPKQESLKPALVDVPKPIQSPEELVQMKFPGIASSHSNCPRVATYALVMRMPMMWKQLWENWQQKPGETKEQFDGRLRVQNLLQQLFSACANRVSSNELAQLERCTFLEMVGAELHQARDVNAQGDANEFMCDLLSLVFGNEHNRLILNTHKRVVSTLPDNQLGISDTPGKDSLGFLMPLIIDAAQMTMQRHVNAFFTCQRDCTVPYYRTEPPSQIPAVATYTRAWIDDHPPPDMLILTPGRAGQKKITTPVLLPDDLVLRFPDYKGETVEYDIVGWTVHRGQSVHSGHYVAYTVIDQNDERQVLLYDKASVKQVSTGHHTLTRDAKREQGQACQLMLKRRVPVVSE